MTEQPPKAGREATSNWAGERIVTEFWASINESNSTNELASQIPLGLGIFVYFPLYVIKALNPFAAIRYTLTNRRIRVDKGMMKKTIQSVALDQVDDIKIENFLKFTRTGDLVALHAGKEVLRMVGIQDPYPARQTILDSVRARTEVQKVLDRQRQTAAAVPAPA